MASSGPRTLAGISQVEMACSFKVTLDRMMLTWDNMAAYMDAINQIVPRHATVSFTDQGDSVVLQFVWAENREVEYRVEDGQVGTREAAAEAPSEPTESPVAEPRALRPREAAGLPKRG